MRAPAYAKQLIERRSMNDHPRDVFVCIGWPSSWLREYVAKSPFANGAAILACIDNTNFDFSALRGLSCCVWIEREDDAARANEFASQIVKHEPSRLFVLNARTGEQTWFRVAAEMQVAA